MEERVIDVIAKNGSGMLKADAVGVSGCSRFGKGALIVGVIDQRVALTMPAESGTSGLPIWRAVNAEGGHVQNGTHCSLRPEWSQPLKDNMEKFLNKTGNVPGVRLGRLDDAGPEL